MMECMAENNAGVEYISGALTRENCTIIESATGETKIIKDIRIIQNCNL